MRRAWKSSWQIAYSLVAGSSYSFEGFFQHAKGFASSGLLPISLPLCPVRVWQFAQDSHCEPITNSSFTDSQWLQASLPVRDWGLGVRRISSLAIPAFLVSAASTISLQDEILANCQLPECPYLTEHLQKCSSSFGQTPNLLPQKQSFWDHPGIQLDRATFETSLKSAFQQASYLAATSRHRSDLLLCLAV